MSGSMILLEWFVNKCYRGQWKYSHNGWKLKHHTSTSFLFISNMKIGNYRNLHIFDKARKQLSFLENDALYSKLIPNGAACKMKSACILSWCHLKYDHLNINCNSTVLKAALTYKLNCWLQEWVTLFLLVYPSLALPDEPIFQSKRYLTFWKNIIFCKSFEG